MTSQNYQSANGTQHQSYTMRTNNTDRREQQTPLNTRIINPNPSKPTSFVIHNLPLNTTADSLRSMVVWSKDFADAVIAPYNPKRQTGFRSAVLTFNTHAGAMQAKGMLDGKQNVDKDAQMTVDWAVPDWALSRQFAGSTGSDSSSVSSSSSSGGPTPRQPSHINGHFGAKVPPTNNHYASHEFPNQGYSHYQSLFSPQSPIGNHLNERTRISGKTLINNDTLDDDETGELIKDPISWAENGSGLSRRPTLPQLPLSHIMANLTLSTNNGGAPPNQMQMSGYPSMAQAYAGPLSPPGMANGGPAGNYQLARQNFPPVNPADQNPPCNTLYVGNLPIDTSEDELKAMFSKQRGYKRLCFRTKQNGPMCFVEFEDVSFATKALTELYGRPLHNSIKGGIRLSFSKNPLGVRSGQNVGNPNQTAPHATMHINGYGGPSFTTANGPPPGLSAPPGLGPNRAYGGGGFMSNMAPVNNQYAGNVPYAGNGYTAQTANGWMQPNYPRAMTAGGPPNIMNGGNQGYPPPPYMMGR